MKISKYLACGALVLSSMLGTSCVGDLDVTPNDPNLKLEPSSKEEIENMLSGVYYDLVTADGLSVSDGGAGSFTRCHFNLQEIVADECFISEKWNDPGYTVLNFNTWGNDNEWIYAAYSRENHLAKIASVYIKALNEFGANYYLPAEIDALKAEAATLRGLAYYYTLDLFGRGPWIDETSVTGQIPPTLERKELFEKVVADLKANVDKLVPANKQIYGRVSREAGYMLLAKLYLNAEVYTGTGMWQQCADALKQVVGTGLQLAPTYKYLFCASNDKYVGNGEILWGIPQQQNFCEAWGGTTYLTVGCWIEAKSDKTPLAAELKRLNNNGTPWSGLRLRPELSQALKGDSRRLIFEGSFQEAIPNLANYDETSCGYMLTKYTNTTEDDYNNTAGADNNGTQMANADYPLFRLADAYLMLAECELHGVKCDGLKYFNLVRQRAGMSTFSALPNATELLKERQCELYMEGHRRSDLVRFKRYTGSAYLWSWKGGVYEGAAIPEYRNLYPVPYQYVGTIGQNPGY